MLCRASKELKPRSSPWNGAFQLICSTWGRWNLPVPAPVFSKRVNHARHHESSSSSSFQASCRRHDSEPLSRVERRSTEAPDFNPGLKSVFRRENLRWRRSDDIQTIQNDSPVQLLVRRSTPSSVSGRRSTLDSEETISVNDNQIVDAQTATIDALEKRPTEQPVEVRMPLPDVNAVEGLVGAFFDAESVIIAREAIELTRNLAPLGPDDVTATQRCLLKLWRSAAMRKVEQAAKQDAA